MSATTQPAPNGCPRRRGKATVAAAGLSVALLGASWFVDMGSPSNQERWQWMIAVALVAVVLTGAAIVFGRGQMRAIFWAPLTGLFYGLVAVIVLGGTLAGVEWLMTRRTPAAALRAAALAGLPAGAVLGVGIGLIGWAVFRLIPPRAPGADSTRKRPRFQFGLRTLLFAVLVVALLLWIAMPAQRNYQHQRAVSQLLDGGALIDFEAEKTGDWFESLIGGRLGPQWYAKVRQVAMGPNTTDEDLRLLEDVAELRHLLLESPEVTDAGITHLARLEALNSLYLACPQVTSEGWGAVARLPQLDSLQLEGSLISDAGLAQLTSPPKLRDLGLRNVTITGSGLARVPPLRIWRLTFHAVNVTDVDLKHLSAFPAIEQLSLLGTSVSDAGLAHLRQMQTLRQLGLGGAGFTGRGLAELSGLPNLEWLDLDATSVQDKDLAHLAQLPRLHTLRLRGTLISDAGLPYLEALPALRHVTIYKTWVTKAGADKLRAVLQAKKPLGMVYGL